jgi:hypothetical protein
MLGVPIQRLVICLSDEPLGNDIEEEFNFGRTVEQL